MDERRWRRSTPLAGIAAPLLIVLPAVGVPPPPHVDVSTAKVVSYVAEHRRGLLTQQVLAVVGVLAMVWFVIQLAHLLLDSEGDAGPLPLLLVATGALSAVGFALAPMPATAMAVMAERPGGLPPDATASLLHAMLYVIGGISMVLAAPLMLTLSLAMLRGLLGIRWLGWLALLVALIDVVTGSALSVSSTYVNTWMALTFAGFGGTFFIIGALAVQVISRRKPQLRMIHPGAIAQR